MKASLLRGDPAGMRSSINADVLLHYVQPSVHNIYRERGRVSNAVLPFENTLHKVIASYFGYFSIISVNLWLC